MLIDFHYYCIKVLCRFADFTEEEAELVAYASQFVDDANKHNPIKISNLEQIATSISQAGINLPTVESCGKLMFNKDIFEPICTAHKSIKDYLHILISKKDEIAHKVYIPFHFIPALQHENFVVTPDSNISKELVLLALKDLEKSQETDNPLLRKFKLIKLGIALHSYADTFSHQNFSGFWDSRANDIELIYYKVGETKWQRCPEKLFGLMPDIGHGEVGDLPDISFLTWSYQKANNQSPVIVNNCYNFLLAAANIYDLLIASTPNAPHWSEIRDRISSLLNYSPSNIINYNYLPTESENHLLERVSNWQNHFPDFFPEQYDEKSWNDQLNDHHKNQNSLNLAPYLYHIAAAEQRKFIKQVFSFKY